jgi:hypothetical protein
VRHECATRREPEDPLSAPLAALVLDALEGARWARPELRYCAANGFGLDAHSLVGLMHSSDGGETWTRQEMPVSSFQFPAAHRFDACASPQAPAA